MQIYVLNLFKQSTTYLVICISVAYNLTILLRQNVRYFATERDDDRYVIIPATGRDDGRYATFLALARDDDRFYLKK